MQDGAAEVGAWGSPERLRELLLGALGAYDVLGIGYEATSDQGCLAARAYEAVVVPMPVLERDETSAADTYGTRKLISKLMRWIQKM